jgi:hypothetical protein
VRLAKGAKVVIWSVQHGAGTQGLLGQSRPEVVTDSCTSGMA